MAEQKLIFSATTPDGLDASKTISNINPEASNEQLAELGQKLTAMTDNTYGKTDRVIKYNCDTEGGGAVVSKQTATITLTATSMSLAELKTALKGENHYKHINGISYNGDGKLYAFISPDSASPSTFIAVTYVYGNDNTNKIFGFMTSSDDFANSITAPFNVIIRADETDNYTAAEATFTVTA